MDPSSTGLASTALGRASQTSTGGERLDRSGQDRRVRARTARTERPGNLIGTRARVPTAGIRTAPAPGALADARDLASRAPTTAGDRQAGRRRDRWDPGQPTLDRDRWGPARVGAQGILAARVNTGPDNRDRGRMAPAAPAQVSPAQEGPAQVSPARGGQARARDRAGRARAGQPLGSTSRATAPAALAVPGASATRRPAASPLPETPGRGIGLAAP